MNVKGTIEDLQKNPTFYIWALIIATSLTVFMTQTFAPLAVVNEHVKNLRQERDEKLREAKRDQEERDKLIREDLKDIRLSLKEVNVNVLHLYKELKIQEGRFEKR